MEIPIQVAVQICPCYPNEPCCVETIPNYADRIGGQLNGVRPNEYLDGIDSINTGLVQVAKTYLGEDKNGNPECSEKTSFPIQHALPYGCTQEFLYQKTVLPMISNFLEGFDISIVTYGQYGTGKSYSMYGPGFDCVYKESEQGIVVRAISDIFAHLMRRPSGCRFSMNVAWIDVRGEEIIDILGEGIVQCHSIDDVFQCLRIGLANRNSEQSHNLFTITIEQQWITPNGLIQHRLSTASFCDLFGTGRILAANEFHEQISVPRDIGLQSLERIVSTLCAPTISMLNNEKTNLMNQYEGTMLTKLLKDSFGGRAQTLMIFCVSSLEHDAFETIQNLQFAYKTQFVRNKVVMNTFSDNNMPLANFIDPNEQDMQKMMHFNPIADKSNRKNLQNSLGQSQFGNSQWLKLISNAEGLFNKLLVNNKTLNEQDRECIEEWIFLKQECDECLSSAGLPSIPHILGPIQETNEPNENSTDDGDGNGNHIGHNKMQHSMQRDMESDGFTILNETDNESDSEQFEYLKERISDLWISFSCKMNEVIDTNYDEFTKKYPKPVMNSCDDKPNDLPCVKTKRSNSVVAVAEPIVYRNSCRRRSIQTGDTGTGDITNAEIAHLKRIADETIQSSQSSTNTVCREANIFLENSDDMHPLRMNKASEALSNLIHQIKIQRNDIDAKENRIADLRHNIRRLQQVIDENRSRVKTKRVLNQRERSLIKQRKLMTEKGNIAELSKIEMNLNEVSELKKADRDSDIRVRECQQQVQERHKLLTILTKEVKKDKKQLEMLESKLKHEMSKNAKEDKKSMALACVDAQMTQLDCVIKERKYLQQTNKDSENEESIRHEIRNLRSQHQRLTDVQCVLHQKQKCNKITEREARKILEYDVTKELIDNAIELKNQLICGRDLSNKKNFFTGNPDLLTQLNKLHEKEMRILLYKCFTKIVDLRESSRQLEEQVIQLEKKCNEWELRERSLLQKFEQFRLREQNLTLRLQKQYETALTKLFEKACENCVSLSSSASDPSMLRLPTHLIQSKHQHQHQHTVSNEIGFNIHGYDRASQQQRRSHRNVTSPLHAPFDAQEANEPKQKSSLFSFLKHSSGGGLKRNLQYPQLMLTNHAQSNPNPENIVTLNPTKKKIIFNIQPHKS